MKTTLLFLSLILVVVLAAIFYGIAYFLVYSILNRNSSHRESKNNLSNNPEELSIGSRLLSGTDKWKKEFEEKSTIWTQISKDGLTLKGRFIQGDSHDYVIVCHGYTGKYTKVLGRAEHFYRNNFSVLTPDARAHGESQGKYRGMGWLEIDDMKGWIEKIVEHDSAANIVLFGQSMGAATVINIAGEELPQNVKAVVEDCSYTSVWDEFAEQMRVKYHLPIFPTMYIADRLCKRKAGYSFKEASPLKQISKCKLPILIIHGDADNFVPCRFAYELYEKANEPKELLIIEGAGHCMSVVKDEKKYWNTVDGFVKKYMQQN